MIKKINHYLKITISILIINSLTALTINAQLNNENTYGLTVVKDIKLLKAEIEVDPGKQMVDVRKEIPDVVLELKYATTDNFMHRRLYPRLHTTYLRLAAVNALRKVEADLKSKNLSLKIFDAYRPYSVTKMMWEKVKDSRYAADPSKGSGHNRGIAVDLTLIGLSSNKELPMGTGFDNFSDTAHQDFKALPPQILKNRALLKEMMEKYGFVSLDTEWWHYSLPNADSYEILDVSLDELKKFDK